MWLTAALSADSHHPGERISLNNSLFFSLTQVLTYLQPDSWVFHMFFRFVRWTFPSSCRPTRWSTTCSRMNSWTPLQPSTSSREPRSWSGPIRASDSRTWTCWRSCRFISTHEDSMPSCASHCLTLVFSCFHSGVPRSGLQPGESSGGFDPVGGPAEGAGLCSRGGEGAAGEHHCTPPERPHQPGNTARWANTPLTRWKTGQPPQDSGLCASFTFKGFRTTLLCQVVMTPGGAAVKGLRERCLKGSKKFGFCKDRRE